MHTPFSPFRPWQAAMPLLVQLFVMALFVNMSYAQGEVVTDEQDKPTSVKIESNSELIEAVNSMDQVLNGEEEPSNPIRDRLVAVGLIVGTFLSLLAILFCYLRLEHASRGFYSGRLQIASLVAVVVVIAVSYLLWTKVWFL